MAEESKTSAGPGIGMVSWLELSIAPDTDVDEVFSFYGDVVGWNRSDMMPGYPLFSHGDGKDDNTAGLNIRKSGEGAEWCPFINVVDIEAVIAEAVRLGGEQVAAVDKGPGGKGASIRAPSGALLGLWQPDDVASAKPLPFNKKGIVWQELSHSGPRKAEMDFYSAVIPDWTADVRNGLPMFFKGEPAGNSAVAHLQLCSDNRWVTYIFVDDPDSAMEKAVAAGAKVIHPVKLDPPTGRYGVFEDKWGAAIGVWRPMTEEEQAGSKKKRARTEDVAGLKLSFTMDATPGDLFMALATQEGLRGWWSASASMEGVPLAVCELRHGDDQLVLTTAALRRMESVEYDVDSAAAAWAETKLHFTIEQSSDSGFVSTVSLTHEGLSEDCAAYADVKAAWETLLGDKLKAYVTRAADAAPLFA